MNFTFSLLHKGQEHANQGSDDDWKIMDIPGSDFQWVQPGSFQNVTKPDSTTDLPAKSRFPSGISFQVAL